MTSLLNLTTGAGFITLILIFAETGATITTGTTTGSSGSLTTNYSAGAAATAFSRFGKAASIISRAGSG